MPQSPDASSHDMQPASISPRPRRLGIRYPLVAVLATLVIGGVVYALKKAGATDSPALAAIVRSDGLRSGAIPVNTVRLILKTIVRTLEQPGTIRPWAQAELYARASGILQTIRHTATPQLAAGLFAQQLAADAPLVNVARAAVAADIAWSQAPQIDIGSFVREGELLL